MEIDLNTKDTEEYEQWLALLREVRAVHEALQNNPNAKGLKLARSLAYNILADIHALIDKAEQNSAQGSATDEEIINNGDLN